MGGIIRNLKFYKMIESIAIKHIYIYIYMELIIKIKISSRLINKPRKKKERFLFFFLLFMNEEN